MRIPSTAYTTYRMKGGTHNTQLGGTITRRCRKLKARRFVIAERKLVVASLLSLMNSLYHDWRLLRPSIHAQRSRNIREAANFSRCAKTNGRQGNLLKCLCDQRERERGWPKSGKSGLNVDATACHQEPSPMAIGCPDQASHLLLTRQTWFVLFYSTLFFFFVGFFLRRLLFFSVLLLLLSFLFSQSPSRFSFQKESKPRQCFPFPF